MPSSPHALSARDLDADILLSLGGGEGLDPGLCVANVVAELGAGGVDQRSWRWRALRNPRARRVPEAGG